MPRSCSAVLRPAGLVLVVLALAPAVAAAAPSPTSGGAGVGGTQPTTSTATPPPPPAKAAKKHSCPLGTVIAQTVPVAPILNVITGDKTDQNCNGVSVGLNAATSGLGAGVSAVGSAVGGSVMAQIAAWIVDGAKTVGGWVASAMRTTTTPILTTQWFRSLYGYIALLGAGLMGLAAMLGVMAAALKRSPEALGEVLYALWRAGIVGGLVLPLTALALSIADAISADLMTHMPATFVTTLSEGWGASGLGGFASSVIGALLALFEILIGLLVWVELLFRAAAIMLATLFVILTLSTAVWPHLEHAHRRLLRILGIFVVMKPIVLLCMLAGGAAVAGGASFAAGLGASVGSLITGVMILALAAFSPWVLLTLLGLEVGSVTRARPGTSRSSSVEAAAAVGGAAAGGELLSAGATGAGSGSRATGGSGTGAGGMGAAGGASRSAPSPGGASGSGGGGSASGATSRMSPVMAAAAGALSAAGSALRPMASAGQSLAQSAGARTSAAAGAHGSLPSQTPLASFGGAGGGGGAASASGDTVPPATTAPAPPATGRAAPAPNEHRAPPSPPPPRN